MSTPSRTSQRIWRWLLEPKDIAALAAFRVLFGLLTFVSSVRFLANGWVRPFFEEPKFFFKFWGFEWVHVLPGWGMRAAFVALALLGLMVGAGLFYRVASVLLLLLFTYIELIDVTNYLNHYYLVSLLALWVACLPLHAAWSLDAWRNPRLRRTTLPSFMTYVLRFQVGLVYVFAAIAKMNTDWLVHAQPLNIWLSARTDTPLIGPWLDEFGVALAMSWAGFLNDLLVVPLLLYRRTRPYAYATVVVFHVLTRVFFSIGMFPFIMIVSALVFFSPSWPRRWLPRSVRSDEPRQLPHPPASTRQKIGLAVVAAYCALHVIVPLRGLWYPGSVLWHEQGMRYAWRVMVREKNGDVMYRVRRNGEPHELLVPPGNYLTPAQEREMSSQPDLILQLAHHIASEYARRYGRPVEVRADAWVSLNGRPAARLIDPNADLARVTDGLGRADWILPMPNVPPPHLLPARRASQPRTASARTDT